MKKRIMVFLCLLLITSLSVLWAGGQSEEETKAGEDKPVRMVFIPKNTGNPYFDSIDTGFQEAAEELGFEYESVGPSTAEATSQIPIIKAQMQRGVDVIAIYLNSVDAMAPIFRDARSKGIKIFFIGTDSPLVDTRDVFIGPVEMDVIGPSLVELEGSFIDYSGDIAILSGTTDSPDHNYWIAGMKKALEDNSKYSDMRIVTIAYGNDDPQKSLTETEALLTKYPDLRGIIAPTTVAVAAAAQAIETAGAAPEVQLTGLGTPNQMRRFIKNGTVEAFALWVPADMGYLAAHMAMQMINGELDPVPGVTVKAGKLGERKLMEDNTINAGDFTIFDESNVDDYDF